MASLLLLLTAVLALASAATAALAADSDAAAPKASLRVCHFALELDLADVFVRGERLQATPLAYRACGEYVSVAAHKRARVQVRSATGTSNDAVDVTLPHEALVHGAHYTLALSNGGADTTATLFRDDAAAAARGAKRHAHARFVHLSHDAGALDAAWLAEGEALRSRTPHAYTDVSSYHALDMGGGGAQRYALELATPQRRYTHSRLQLAEGHAYTVFAFGSVAAGNFETVLVHDAVRK